MITFTCSGCGRPFSVRDQDAGRSAKCKTCGALVTVPEPVRVAAAAVEGNSAGPAAVASQPAIEPAPQPRRIPMRLRRLTADAQQMAAAFRDFGPIRIVSTEGDPPEVYQLEYHVKGLERPAKKKQPVPREQHLVEIRLTSEYPRTSPQCRMLTPVFHPNIDPSHICVGDHWTAGERLVDLAVRIGEMIAYQAYNIKSPLDAEAAMWADLQTAELPVDPRSLRPGNLD
jgi:ubiquitin-protein ligase